MLLYWIFDKIFPELKDKSFTEKEYVIYGIIAPSVFLAIFALLSTIDFYTL